MKRPRLTTWPRHSWETCAFSGALSLLIFLSLVLTPALSARPATWPTTGDDDANLGGDDLWWDGFAPHGAVGPSHRVWTSDITAGVIFEGALIVGGEFRYMNGVPVPGLARWTGKAWEPFGEGLPWEVLELAVYNGQLIAGGTYDAEIDSTASGLYRWTGSDWAPFDPQYSRADFSRVDRLKVAGNRLYAILWQYGDFHPDPDSRHIVVRWDGLTWEEIGFTADLISRGARSPRFNDVDEFRGDPIVASYDLLSDEDSLGYVYRWTGSTTEILGEGLDDSAFTLSVFQDRLFVGGWFTKAGSLATGPVAAWDGFSWSALGEPLTNYWGYRPLIRHLYPSGDKLYAYGEVDRIGGSPTGNVLIWDGASWSPTPWYFREFFGSYPGFLLEHGDGLVYGGTLYLEGQRYDGMALWNGEDWVPFPSRGIQLHDVPTAMLPTDEGLVVAGEFTLPDQFAATRAIARWDGSGWTFLAKFISDDVLALARYRGRLVAAGSFNKIDGVEVQHIAHLVNGQWKQVGNGTNDEVAALQVYDGHLVAGGAFTEAGGREAKLVAAWDGLSWSPLGKGLHGTDPDWVQALEIYGGRLIAAGHFDWAGERAADIIAAWDGRSWSPLGPRGVFGMKVAMIPRILQLQSWRGLLIARGVFDSLMGQPVEKLAVWNGEVWAPLEPALYGGVQSLGVYQGRLLAGGWIRKEYEGPEDFILQFDGEHWLTMGSGLTLGRSSFHSPSGVNVSAEWRGSLYLGGYFLVAGGKPSSFIARWDGATLAPPRFDRLRAAPNPATDAATLHYRLDGPGPVSIHVFDVRGRRVATLREGFMTGGDHTETWDLRDGHGRRVPVGVYFLRVDSPLSHAAEKIVVIR